MRITPKHTPIRIRQRAAAGFASLSEKSTSYLGLGEDVAGVTVVIGTKRDGTTRVQSLAFDPGRWTLTQAKEWAEKHKETIMKVAKIHIAEDLFDIPKAKRVDTEKGVVEGLKIVGLESKNKRRYKESALRAAAPKYENCQVNLNHTNGQRKVEDRFGQVHNPQFIEGDGIFGDVHFNPKHPFAERFAWFAENQPNAIGPSHNVIAGVTRDGGAIIVESIESVASVDIVADPATTKGLFEDARPTPLADAIREIEADKSIPEDQRHTLVLSVTENHFGAASQGGKPPKHSGGNDMEWNDITAEGLLEHRKDLAEKLLSESQQAKDLARANKDLDALQVKEALRTKRETAVKLCEGLKKEAVTDLFVETLVSAKDEDAMKKLVEDRKTLTESEDPTSKGRDKIKGKIEGMDGKQAAAYFAG